MFIELSAKIENTIDKERPDIGKRIKDIPLDKLDRFRFYFDGINARDLQQTCVNSFPSVWIKNRIKFCLSPEWMSWQYVRLTGVIVQEYHCLRQMGGVPREKTAEHDYQDMEYVLLLSRADVLITRDEFVKALAKAAFPEKDIFACIEDVPRSYRIE